MGKKRIFLDKHSLEGFGGFYNKTVFEFEKDKATVILGINGSGKTTLMNSIFASIALCLDEIIPFNKNELEISQNTISIGKESAEIESNVVLADLAWGNSTLMSYKVAQNGNVNQTSKEYSNIVRFFLNYTLIISQVFCPYFDFFNRIKISISKKR